jgi:thiol-disulfide isomerase/thioredoxin
MSRSSKTRKREERSKGKGLGWAGWIAIIIIVIIVIWAAYSLAQPPAPRPTLSGGAPDFTLPVVGPNGLTGEKVTLSSFHGKVILLEFMVPQCIHCQNMAPVLEQLHAQYSTSSDVVFVSVASPFGFGATPTDVASFIRTYHSSWTYLWDSSGTNFSAYGVSGTPTFFLISKNGSIVQTYEGVVAPATIAADIARLRGG